MERFVRYVVVGGAVLVAGLWTVTLSETQSLAWAAGVGLVLVGVAALADGIRRELDVGR
ncbi:hypothetical protein NDI76_13510 [Halogeometricum sp. S1BR25-6]|uniref:Secreted protein n=1 Tax=Halogeometricum salsisoli TaxID=2950536 RepID=A0ABU2GG32_9EURY|nr:hypothetical protein [Halogeometricum sp. S1BR25-6]MDS0299761.1 hypothetical protein [Halogeometricum sp. S1BR25-6]